MRSGARYSALRVFGGAVIIACGSSGGNGAGGSHDGGAGDDGSITTGASSGSGGASSGASSGNGGGSSGGASSGASGGGGCPPYQSLCNGSCIPTVIDPNNCGGCGVKCTGSTTCSGGTCASGCLMGFTACNHSCVSTASDNANCGTCGHACPSGQGCVDGGCVNAIKVGPAPAKCANGGPPINIATGTSTSSCAGALAQTTFTWALCSCTNITASDILLTDAYDSTKGPYPPNPPILGGSVGLDGTFSSQNAVTIGGSLWDSSSTGLSSDGSATVKEELHVGGPVNVQQFGVGLSGFVNGSVSGSTLTIGKDLTVPNGVTPNGTTVKGTILHVTPPVSVPAPCDCSASALIPVASIVAAKATKNDDSLIMLDPAALAGPGAPTRLDLPCGEYYLTRIANSVSVTIAAHGRTALYIGGDVTPSSPLTITLDPTAQLDLFVGGTISSQDMLTIGNINYPALSRTYIGTSGTLSFTSGATIGSNIYAPLATIDWSADSDIYGSVFCHSFNGSSRTAIHYDEGVLKQGATCPGPGGSSSSGSGSGATSSSGSSSGTPPTGCGSCKDCGNQACINGACGSCTSSAQCCAPLLCASGVCVPAPP